MPCVYCNRSLDRRRHRLDGRHFRAGREQLSRKEASRRETGSNN